LKNELERLFSEAERLEPPPSLWRRIAERSPLAAGAAPERSFAEMPFLRAAAVVLAAGLLALAAFGALHHRGPEPVREAAAEIPSLAPAAAGDEGEGIIDPDLLDWQAGLGTFDSEADEAGETL
jgi:hypothetical protein